MDDVVLLRQQVGRYEPPPGDTPIPAYLGIDVGSVSTNLVAIDDSGVVIHDIYLRTAGRPIEAVQRGLRELDEKWGRRLVIEGVGTTGSGRELIAEVAGADVVNDEITAHKTGALHISNTLGGEPVDTIFEIGGQDSKFISIENGVVVDFAMNEACAAGTGSFLEEQAEKLGIRIKEEFARLALSSRAPTRLGERCTVFMERDVTGWLHKGETVPSVVAGLAYSIALNYLNRVVRGRKIGNVIYFQGGTAYNDAVAAAFAGLLEKRITVPPYNGVMGAIGMALIARQWRQATRGVTRFRGYHLDRLEMSTRDFVCKACTNYCDIKEFTIEGQKSFWGDKCSDKFRKVLRSGRKPVIEDLFAFREKLLEEITGGPLDAPRLRPASGRLRVGIPRTMSMFDRYSFWHRYFTEIGVDVVLSRPTDPRIAADGVDMALAQPCYPVQLAHGHTLSLAELGVDYILAPNVLDAESHENSPCIAHMCPWNQTLPFVLQCNPRLENSRHKLLVPSVHFQLGREHVRRALAAVGRKLGVRRIRSDRAVDAAYAAQRRFEGELLEAGRAALETLEKTGEPGLLLAGRGYNIYDRGINCDIPRKLRYHYGANVIPLDFLVTGREPTGDLHPNMYWTSGQKILEAARLAAARPYLHIIYISNFKCGPDSYIKYFARHTAGAPLLVLQFDGHGNDAGYMTRCEAYLDSKGILRCYKSPPPAEAPKVLSAAIH
jgi:predicted CoA-substrate-specific enzyme activase